MKKNILIILLCGIMILGLVGCNEKKENKEKVENEKKESYKKELYSDIVNKENKENSDLVYDLIYIDDDEIPELIVNSKGYWINGYTIKDNQVYKIIDSWPYGAMGNAGYEYIEKKNTIRNYNSDYAGLIKYVTYYKIDDKYEVTPYYDKELYIYYFDDKNNNGTPDEGEYTDEYKEYTYYYGDNIISKEEFDKYQLDGDYKFIEGTKNYNEIKQILEEKEK